LTDNEREERIHNDQWVIILADPFHLSLLTLPNNDKIQPTGCVLVRFYAVGKMHDQHQEDEGD
jgi:hypothetical protein